MSIAISGEMMPAMDAIEMDASLSRGIIGEFSPLDEFNVSFSVRAASLDVFPPEWVVHGSIRHVGPHTLPIALFNLGPQNRTQIVRVGGLPGEYAGTIELALSEGKGPSFTVKYALQQDKRVPLISKGTYVFYWSA